jgi:aryl-alcohol dehydrogenase-like predicted oxidoreductase
MRLVDAVKAVASRKDATPAQVALAWVHQRTSALGVPVVPIPGTKRQKYLEENVAALDVTLDESDLAELDPLSEQVVGARY